MQLFLLFRYMRRKHWLLLRDSVDLEVIANERHSSLPADLELAPHDQMHANVISFWGTYLNNLVIFIFLKINYKYYNLILQSHKWKTKKKTSGYTEYFSYFQRYNLSAGDIVSLF